MDDTGFCLLAASSPCSYKSLLGWVGNAGCVGLGGGGVHVDVVEGGFIPLPEVVCFVSPFWPSLVDVFDCSWLGARLLLGCWLVGSNVKVRYAGGWLVVLLLLLLVGWERVGARGCGVFVVVVIVELLVVACFGLIKCGLGFPDVHVEALVCVTCCVGSNFGELTFGQI